MIHWPLALTSEPQTFLLWSTQDSNRISPYHFQRVKKLDVSNKQTSQMVTSCRHDHKADVEDLELFSTTTKNKNKKTNLIAQWAKQEQQQKTSLGKLFCVGMNWLAMVDLIKAVEQSNQANQTKWKPCPRYEWQRMNEWLTLTKTDTETETGNQIQKHRNRSIKREAKLTVFPRSHRNRRRSKIQKAQCRKFLEKKSQ